MCVSLFDEFLHSKAFCLKVRTRTTSRQVLPVRTSKPPACFDLLRLQHCERFHPHEAPSSCVLLQCPRVAHVALGWSVKLCTLAGVAPSCSSDKLCTHAVPISYFSPVSICRDICCYRGLVDGFTRTDSAHLPGDRSCRPGPHSKTACHLARS